MLDIQGIKVYLPCNDVNTKQTITTNIQKLTIENPNAIGAVNKNNSLQTNMFINGITLRMLTIKLVKMFIKKQAITKKND